MVRRRNNHDVDAEVGARILRQRLKLKLSQVALGKLIGVSFQQVQKYERGHNAIASSRIPSLCRALQIVPNDLFGIK
jgi:transcriptional regulator with XRE-family HTH domain